MRNSVLDGFYIPTRYPNGLPGGIPAEAYPQETAESAVALATQVVGFVDTLIG
jgi:HEPN domain-containing protein